MSLMRSLNRQDFMRRLCASIAIESNHRSWLPYFCSIRLFHHWKHSQCVCSDVSEAILTMLPVYHHKYNRGLLWTISQRTGVNSLQISLRDMLQSLSICLSRGICSGVSNLMLASYMMTYSSSKAKLSHWVDAKTSLSWLSNSFRMQLAFIILILLLFDLEGSLIPLPNLILMKPSIHLQFIDSHCVMGLLSEQLRQCGLGVRGCGQPVGGGEVCLGCQVEGYLPHPPKYDFRNRVAFSRHLAHLVIFTQSAKMQNETERNNPLDHLSCAFHPEELITFICISHDECPTNNLLCVECIDELNGHDLHTLISLKKFHRFITTYDKSAGNCLERTKIMVDKIREQINHRIANLQMYSLSVIDSQRLMKSSNLDLKHKIKILARKKIWARLQKIGVNSPDFLAEIEDDIDNFQKNTTDVLNDLLTYTQICFKKLEEEPTRKIESRESETPLVCRLRKRTNGRLNEVAEDLEASDEMQSESPEAQVVSITEQPLLRNRKTKRARFKRYSNEEKARILSQIKTSAGKKAVARKHKIATSTLLRWEKVFLETMEKKRTQQREKKNKVYTEIKIEDSS